MTYAPKPARKLFCILFDYSFDFPYSIAEDLLMQATQVFERVTKQIDTLKLVHGEVGDLSYFANDNIGQDLDQAWIDVGTALVVLKSAAAKIGKHLPG